MRRASYLTRRGGTGDVNYCRHSSYRIYASQHLGNLPFMTGLAGNAHRAALRRALLLGLAVFAALLLALVLLPARREPPSPPLPNPNGYDDFLKAASLLTGDILNASSLGHDDLRALVTSNAQALALARLGLSRACSVHTDDTITNLSSGLRGMSEVRTLCLLLAQEGHLAEMENRNSDAARCYLDSIRLGNACSRGGVIIQRLVGIAFESVGRVPLAQLTPKLSCQQARSVITELEKADATGVAWKDIISNEHRFERYELAHDSGFHPVSWIIMRWQRWRSDRLSLHLHNAATAHLRLLATELALRCYQSSTGRAAARLDDLVPDYLAKVPQDPFTGRALIYRPRGTNWLLYSVGPDGVDDGGKPIVRVGGYNKGDILFDSR
jgi:hypothetical protein